MKAKDRYRAGMEKRLLSAFTYAQQYGFPITAEILKAATGTVAWDVEFKAMHAKRTALRR